MRYLFIVFMVVSLAACGKKKGEAPKNNNNTSNKTAQSATVAIEVPAKITEQVVQILESAEKNENGRNAKGDTFVCTASISMGEFGYRVEGDKLVLDGGSVDRISGETGSIYGEWKLPDVEKEGLKLSSVMVIKEGRVGGKVTCTPK